MIRLRAAAWFSTETCRLEITASKRFCEAPSVAALAVDGVDGGVDVGDHGVDGRHLTAVLSITPRPAPVLSVPATAR